MTQIGIRNWIAPLSFAFITVVAACGAEVDSPQTPGPSRENLGKTDSSAIATFVEFKFDGELLTNYSWNSRNTIQDQLLYTMGLLNGEKSVGRLDQVVLTNVQKSQEGSMTRISYTATMPVAWAKNTVPSTYTLKLPRDVSHSGQNAFTAKYKDSCVDYTAHDVDTGSMWYYYRPKRCTLQDDDIVEISATVSPSAINTTGKYPEYHKVWEDNTLRVVSVFGKYKEESESNSDAGIAAYNRFVRSVKSKFGNASLQTIPSSVPYSPGVATPDVTFNATLSDGRKIEIVALLISKISSTSSAFNTRYETLSRDADLIAYNGHSGLGQNVKALARKGSWKTGQYAIIFLNGCDSYAYVDSALADAHMDVNSDDTTGMKYLDIVTNAMPSYFSNMANASMSLINGLLAYETPKTYEQIFNTISSTQVILVSGEQDNVYHPGYDPDGPDTDPEPWTGMDESGTVAKDTNDHFSTQLLEAGKYRFELAGSGDADLYLRSGSKPTTASFDCRPYRWGTAEVCDVELNSATKVYVMVRGWDPTSDYTLKGSRLDN